MASADAAHKTLLLRPSTQLDSTPLCKAELCNQSPQLGTHHAAGPNRSCQHQDTCAYREAKDNNRGSWYLAYILDTNEEERAKGKTVELARAQFTTDKKRYTILDAPGHRTFVAEMIAGAAQADVGVLIISARQVGGETACCVRQKCGCAARTKSACCTNQPVLVAVGSHHSGLAGIRQCLLTLKHLKHPYGCTTAAELSRLHPGQCSMLRIQAHNSTSLHRTSTLHALTMLCTLCRGSLRQGLSRAARRENTHTWQRRWG